MKLRIIIKGALHPPNVPAGSKEQVVEMNCPLIATLQGARFLKTLCYNEFSRSHLIGCNGYYVKVAPIKTQIQNMTASQMITPITLSIGFLLRDKGKYVWHPR